MKDELKVYLKRGLLEQFLGKLGEGGDAHSLRSPGSSYLQERITYPGAQQCWVPVLRKEGLVTQRFRPFEG